MVNRLYTIRLRNFGILFSRAIFFSVKYVGKLIVDNRFYRLILPDFLLIKTYHEKSVIWNWAVGGFKYRVED